MGETNLRYLSTSQNISEIDIDFLRAPVWVTIDGPTGTLNDSFGVSSVSFVAQGRQNVNFAVTMADTNYIAMSNSQIVNTTLFYCNQNTAGTVSTTTSEFYNQNGAGTANPGAWAIAIFGVK